jgi:glycosyltransferase involved in cell wall biosynthesis
MVSLEGIPSEQIVVFPTGYVPHPVTPEIEIRSELGLPPDAALIGTAAMFRVEKAIDVLIAAHARVLETFADAYLLIAGDGDCRPQLERQVDELGIGHRIRFLGTRHDIDSILRSLDVAAMSSDWEGMPLFAFECMAAGTPLVATSVGGVPEIVDDGISGLLVPPRDPAALANAIMRLLADDSLRERLGAASAARIDEYRIEAVAGSIADMYETLLADARAPLTARMLDPA